MPEDTLEEQKSLADDESFALHLRIDSLCASLAKTTALLKRWRTDGATDHRLPRDTVDLLESLGETL